MHKSIQIRMIPDMSAYHDTLYTYTYHMRLSYSYQSMNTECVRLALTLDYTRVTIIYSNEIFAVQAFNQLYEAALQLKFDLPVTAQYATGAIDFTDVIRKYS